MIEICCILLEELCSVNIDHIKMFPIDVLGILNAQLASSNSRVAKHCVTALCNILANNEQADGRPLIPDRDA